MDISVIVLAAGKGTRMLSDMPKVLHPIGGRPMLQRVIDTANQLSPKLVQVVCGFASEKLQAALSDQHIGWVEQSEQLGTAHAVLQAIPNCADDQRVIILYGDVPLISEATLTNLLNNVPNDGVGVVVTKLTNPTGFGRIIRDEQGHLVGIVEEKDADAKTKGICEVNTGIIVANAADLKRWLPAIKNDNRQQEYYLPDIIPMAVAENKPVHGVSACCSMEVMGVNNRVQQAELERYFQYQQALKLCEQGAHIYDPARFDLRNAKLTLGKDISFDINVILEGEVTLGNGCKIGANVHLRNVTLSDNVEIKANSIIEHANIESGAVVGPFARIRPGTTLKANAKVGNFVEVKNSTLGQGSKANHLTYLGDAEIHENVNIGAGTITCNYDGKNKSKTIIKNRVFVGSNTALVAPITIEEDATVAAGSTITEKVNARQLALARSKQVNIDNWIPPKDR